MLFLLFTSSERSQALGLPRHLTQSPDALEVSWPGDCLAGPGEQGSGCLGCLPCPEAYAGGRHLDDEV